MKKYLELSLMMITSFLASCTGGGYYGRQGPGGWGHVMHYGFGYGGMFILKKRYAKGEITKEEYKRMKKDLEG